MIRNTMGRRLYDWFWQKPLKTFGWRWWSQDDDEEFDCPTTARPRLIDTWLALAQQCTDPERQLRYYEGVLKLEPTHPEACRKVRELRGRLSPLNPMEKADVTHCATS